VITRSTAASASALHTPLPALSTRCLHECRTSSRLAACSSLAFASTLQEPLMVVQSGSARPLAALSARRRAKSPACGVHHALLSVQASSAASIPMNSTSHLQFTSVMANISVTQHVSMCIITKLTTKRARWASCTITHAIDFNACCYHRLWQSTCQDALQRMHRQAPLMA
jgi:hypothetical protein